MTIQELLLKKVIKSSSFVLEKIVSLYSKANHKVTGQVKPGQI